MVLGGFGRVRFRVRGGDRRFLGASQSDSASPSSSSSKSSGKGSFADCSYGPGQRSAATRGSQRAGRAAGDEVLFWSLSAKGFAMPPMWSAMGDVRREDDRCEPVVKVE